MIRSLVLVSVVWILTGCASTPSEAGKASSGASATEEAPSEGCHTPLGFIPEGGSAPGYLHAVEQGGMNCQQGEVTCKDGDWSGPYIYPSCVRQP